MPEARLGKDGERHPRSAEVKMAESVYKVIELVGTSTESWEKAAAAAVALARRASATSAWPRS
jgi:hypothetical protein